MSRATAPPRARVDADLAAEVDVWTDGALFSTATDPRRFEREYDAKLKTLQSLYGTAAVGALEEAVVAKTRRWVGALIATTATWASACGLDPECLVPDDVCDASPRNAFIDWSTFWDRDANEAEWVFPDVLARGRGHAVYASHKTGKSLLMLSLSAALATGKDPVVVTYLDYEMTEADLLDRLEDMGYGPKTDFARLRYALLPTLPPLDTSAGARALMGMVDGVQAQFPNHHQVVVIDTISRALEGKENEADTFRAFYTYTGIELKRRGVTWVRLDHAGHEGKHQRGSSSKGDDVDVVWKLTATENGLRLHRDVARMSWVLPNVTFRQFDDPLRYVRRSADWPAGTAEVANILDRLEVPLSASTRAASAALRTINEGRRRQVVVAAMRFRIDRLKDAPGGREPPASEVPTAEPSE